MRKESNDQQSCKKEKKKQGRRLTKGNFWFFSRGVANLCDKIRGKKVESYFEKCTLVNFGVENSCSLSLFGNKYSSYLGPN